MFDLHPIGGDGFVSGEGVVTVDGGVSEAGGGELGFEDFED